MMRYEDLFNKLNCWNQSMKFDWYRYSQHPEVKSICNELISGFDFSSTAKKKSIARGKEYLKALVCNFFVAWKSGKNVAIPRDVKFYSDKGNFRFSLVSRDIFLQMLDYLVAGEWVDEARGYKNMTNGKGYVSAYWATRKLYSKFSNISWEAIETKASPEIILKDIEKKIIRFKGNEFTVAVRGKLTVVNELYNENDFRTVLDGEYNSTRLFPRLSAIYNRGSFGMGGRLYCLASKGMSYQSLNKAERQRIRINGSNTVELDFSGLHLNMLYAMQGLQLTTDPYSFVGADMRKYAKLALLVLINAESERAALFSLINDYPEVKNWKAILSACKKFHAPIAEYFNSGIGLQLQNLDGAMALEIISYFAKKNICCLPIHDSFIVETRWQDELKAVMMDVYKRHNNGFCCEIK